MTCAEIEFIVEQLIDRQFNCTGLDLFAQHHRQQPGISVDRFVSGHVLSSCFERWNMDSADGSSFRVGEGFCTASTSEMRGGRPKGGNPEAQLLGRPLDRSIRPLFDSKSSR